MKRPVVDPASVSVLTAAALTVVVTQVVINVGRGKWTQVGMWLMVARVLMVILALLPPVKDR